MLCAADLEDEGEEDVAASAFPGFLGAAGVEAFREFIPIFHCAWYDSGRPSFRGNGTLYPSAPVSRRECVSLYGFSRASAVTPFLFSLFSLRRFPSPIVEEDCTIAQAHMGRQPPLVFVFSPPPPPRFFSRKRPERRAGYRASRPGSLRPFSPFCANSFPASSRKTSPLWRRCPCSIDPASPQHRSSRRARPWSRGPALVERAVSSPAVRTWIAPCAVCAPTPAVQHEHFSGREKGCLFFFPGRGELAGPHQPAAGRPLPARRRRSGPSPIVLDVVPSTSSAFSIEDFGCARCPAVFFFVRCGDGVLDSFVAHFRCLFSPCARRCSRLRPDTTPASTTLFLVAQRRKKPRRQRRRRRGPSAALLKASETTATTTSSSAAAAPLVTSSCASAPPPVYAQPNPGVAGDLKEDPCVAIALDKWWAPPATAPPLLEVLAAAGTDAAAAAYLTPLHHHHHHLSPHQARLLGGPAGAAPPAAAPPPPPGVAPNPLGPAPPPELPCLFLLGSPPGSAAARGLQHRFPAVSTR
ncbi:hypothetical protein HPB51_009989 [Rhipicephalus microplus]|uniref:Uncharacterized protein n=1 Tax=Rhipicephalus microplus TaxID=6941 RepID=A0A9J6ET30_RHIMP|nr:hypothetical protein HPB51_009989 [Rhipicephalus microplus]